ncbi:MAG: hypothetical protein ACRDKA_13440 [Actinomycetota bacterium]
MTRASAASTNRRKRVERREKLGDLRQEPLVVEVGGLEAEPLGPPEGLVDRLAAVRHRSIGPGPAIQVRRGLPEALLESQQRGGERPAGHSPGRGDRRHQFGLGQLDALEQRVEPGAGRGPRLPRSPAEHHRAW